MARDLDRRRNYIDRLKSAPTIAALAASALGVVVYLAKPLTIQTGDIDITGPLVVFGPVINQIRMGYSEDAAIQVMFWCDYRNATIGTTSAAGLSTCANAGDWNGTYVGAGNLNGIIIDSAGYTAKGWPTAKIFRIRSQLSAGASEPQVRGLTAPWASWDTVAVGDSTHFRAYVLMEVPDSVPTSQGHPIEARTGNTWPWGLRFRTEEDSTKWGLAIVGAQGQGADQKIWDLVSLNRMILPKDTTIRLEWQVKRTYVDSIQLHMRVYVWNGSTFTLRYSDADFDRRSATGTLADNVNVIKLNADSLNTLVGGSNGFDFGSTFQINYMLQGAFAVCDVWCGAWPIAGTEN